MTILNKANIYTEWSITKYTYKFEDTNLQSIHNLELE